MQSQLWIYRAAIVVLGALVLVATLENQEATTALVDAQTSMANLNAADQRLKNADAKLKAADVNLKAECDTTRALLRRLATMTTTSSTCDMRTGLCY